MEQTSGGVRIERGSFWKIKIFLFYSSQKFMSTKVMTRTFFYFWAKKVAQNTSKLAKSGHTGSALLV